MPNPTHNTVIRPYGTDVLVCEIRPSTEEDEHIHEGCVLAVGPGIYRDGAYEPLDVAVGDTILYSGRTLLPARYGRRLVVVNEYSRLAVISPSVVPHA